MERVRNKNVSGTVPLFQNLTMPYLFICLFILMKHFLSYCVYFT